MSATGSEDYASSGDYDIEDYTSSDGDQPLELEESNDLVCAASDGLVDLLDFFIGSGHDVTGHEGCMALYYAAAEGHAAVVKSLLAAGTPVDGNCGQHVDSPLVQAAAGGHVEVIELLLAAGANIEAATVGTRTALSMASATGHIEAVASLLKAGAHVNGAGVRSGPYHNPLIEAADHGHAKVVELLLANGADIETSDRYNNTALSHASEKGHLGVVRVLLQAGARVNWHEAVQTPLYFSGERGPC